MPLSSRIPWPGIHFVGIDENGMGPLLGPLVITSVLATADAPEGRGARVATSRARGKIAERIGDSKKLVAFDDNALGEAWARAMAARAGVVATTPTELLAAIAIDGASFLRELCPSHHVDLCWGDEGEAFASDDAAVAACASDLDALAAKGLNVVRTRVAIMCARRLNDALDVGHSRFDVDLHAMERLTLAARNDVGADVYALCGKVGGFDFYGERFGPLAGRLFTTLLEGRARSEYQLPGVGRLAFVRDADETHLIVGLASLVGKWVRDHLMRRVVRWHRAHVPDLPEASGYHDPVTTAFVRATNLVRKKQKVALECFERSSLAKREQASPVSGVRAKAPTSSRQSPKSQVQPTLIPLGEPQPKGAASSLRSPRPS